jgi:protein-S-isoprenylcysteine O-methyltransferase Ste14
MKQSRVRAFFRPTAIAALVGAVIGAALTLRHPRPASSPPFGIHELGTAVMGLGFAPPMLAAIAMWALFSMYWEIKAKSASETKRSESRGSRSIHVTLVSLAQLLIFLPVPGLRARILPESFYVPAIGLLMEILFLMLAVWARELLGRNWSGAVSAKHDHELVRSGPYAVVRHPIYTAMLGVYASMMLVAGEMHGLVGVLIAAIAYARKIRIEERYLCEVFGTLYERYRDETWALIPGVL